MPGLRRALALLTIILSVLADTASAQEPIIGDVPAEGVALLVTGEAIAADELTAALLARGCSAQTIAVTEGGTWRTHVPGAPAFVNASFPAALDAGTAFAVRCSAALAGGFVLMEAEGVGSGGFATQTDVRVAAQAGYDRLVLEFAEDVIPPYTIEYTTEPQFTCGEGAPVAVAGDATLRIRLQSTRLHDDDGALAFDSRHLQPGLAVIEEVREVCGFEGEAVWLVGLSRQTEFRLLILQQPGRIVIDVPHAECEECAAPGGQGGLAGVAFAGPQCPVLREGENCPDRLVDVPLVIRQAGAVVATAETNAGLFRVSLPAGTYDIERDGSGPFPAMGAHTVTVPTGTYAWTELRLDTGIR